MSLLMEIGLRSIHSKIYIHFGSNFSSSSSFTRAILGMTCTIELRRNYLDVTIDHVHV